jgi:hypothetical protein
MPGFPFPGRPGGEHDEPLLDMIIARRALPPDAPQEMHDLARMLAAAAGPAEPGELAGEAAMRAAFSQAASSAGISSAAWRPARRRRPRHREQDRSRARLAAVMVVAAAGLGSVLAAYSDVLPSPIQQLAHVAVAAPAPHSSGPPQPATMGTGRPAPHPAPATSQPAPGQRHSAGIAPLSGHATSSQPQFTPRTSRPTGDRGSSASCAASKPPSPSPSAKGSTQPTPTAWPTAVTCGGGPWGSAVQPTLYPYVP